jgi:Fe-S-cluster-containing hydrogenase component 2
MKTLRKIIEIDEELCNGCGECVPACAEGAIEIVEGKARLAAERYCDGLGACLGNCPTGALKIIEREAEEFDEEAVEQFLQERQGHTEERSLPCGCPSTRVMSLEQPPTVACDQANMPRMEEAPSASYLSHWPIQIRLVPPTAGFLRNADLLVAADCTAAAHPNFQRDLLKGKVLLLGCPKFDDPEDCVKRFSEIFRKADIRSVTTVTMEVPCCQGLPVIVKKGMEAAGKDVPLKQVVVGIRGTIQKRKK